MVTSGAVIVLLNDQSQKSSQIADRSAVSEVDEALLTLSAQIEAEISKMQLATMDAAAEMMGRSLDGPEANGSLLDVFSSCDYVIDCLNVDRNKTIVSVQPSGYEDLIGQSLADQDAFERSMSSGQPVFTPLMPMVEGYYAVFWSCPILDGNGTVVGAISTMFRPDSMIENMSNDILSDSELSAMVLQHDGVVLYDKDPTQLGKNTITDPIYQDFPEIQAIMVRMVNESNGIGQYSFVLPGTTNVVRKEITWTTIAILEMDWTVSIIRPL